MTLKAFSDTIAAISTPPGTGGIAVVRLSGPDAGMIVKKISTLKKLKPNQARLTKLFDKNQLIDEGIVTWFQSPHSYTGEDTAEISCHGGPVVTQHLLNVILANGARPAAPGEFTQRAFINGKIDLVQAESVIDLIEAKTTAAADVPVNHLSGLLSVKIGELRDRLLSMISHLEVHLDYPDEEELEPSESYEKTVSAICSDIEELINTFDTGRLLKDGITVVIAGKPNVGKSSLLNLLLSQNRAIVSDIPGTTRDTIEEWVQLKGYPLCIIDTAGYRDSDDRIEQLGVERTRDSLNKADVVLWVVDASTGLTPEDEMIREQCEDRNMLVIVNKADLDHKQADTLCQKLSKTFENVCALSVLKKEGVKRFIDVLEHQIKLLVHQGGDLSQNPLILNNQRHYGKLTAAKTHLMKSRDSIRNKLPEDFWLIDLRQALSELGEIIGEDISEEVLNDIFSRFCVGK